MQTPAPRLRADLVVLATRPEAVQPGDAQLVDRALDGEAWAFEAIYRRYVNVVAGTVRRMLRHTADTEDVVQETFLLAFEQLTQLEDALALRVWLVRIGVSRAHRIFRRRRLVAWITGEVAATALAEQADSGLSPEERAELALLDQALSRVAPLRRTPWILRHVEGYPLEEIATICGMSLATAKRRIAEVEEQVRSHSSAKGGRA
jgi:RNA polymerase sigma-70 factor (ECF subfamily)